MRHHSPPGELTETLWSIFSVQKFSQVSSPCCNFNHSFQAEAIVDPGELDITCEGCGVEPLKEGQAISVHVSQG